jgi:hypothetical protein
VAGLAGSSLDVCHGVADSLEVLGLLVGNADAALLLRGLDDLDHRKPVHVNAVCQRLVKLQVRDRHTGHVVDDLGEIRTDFFGGGH